MIHAHACQFLRRLERRANGAFRLGMDTTSPNSMPRDRVVADPITRNRLPCHWPDGFRIIAIHLSAQDQTPNLGAAHIQNSDHAALKCGFAHGSHCTLSIVKIGH